MNNLFDGLSQTKIGDLWELSIRIELSEVWNIHRYTSNGIKEYSRTRGIENKYQLQIAHLKPHAKKAVMDLTHNETFKSILNGRTPASITNISSNAHSQDISLNFSSGEEILLECKNYERKGKPELTTSQLDSFLQGTAYAEEFDTPTSVVEHIIANPNLVNGISSIITKNSTSPVFLIQLFRRPNKSVSVIPLFFNDTPNKIDILDVCIFGEVERQSETTFKIKTTKGINVYGRVNLSKKGNTRENKIHWTVDSYKSVDTLYG